MSSKKMRSMRRRCYLSLMIAVTVEKIVSRALAALEFALSSEKEQVSYAQRI
jgi:hypothetical protein